MRSRLAIYATLSLTESTHTHECISKRRPRCLQIAPSYPVHNVLRARQPLAGVDVCSAGDITHQLSKRQGGSAQGVGLRLRGVLFASVNMYMPRLDP